MNFLLMSVIVFFAWVPGAVWGVVPLPKQVDIGAHTVEEGRVGSKSLSRPLDLLPVVPDRVSQAPFAEDPAGRRRRSRVLSLRVQVREARRSLRRLSDVTARRDEEVYTALARRGEVERQAQAVADVLAELRAAQEARRARQAMERVERELAAAAAREAQIQQAAEEAIRGAKKAKADAERAAKIEKRRQSFLPGLEPRGERRLSAALVALHLADIRGNSREREAAEVEGELSRQRESLVRLLDVFPDTHTDEFARNFREEVDALERSSTVPITEECVLSAEGATLFDKLKSLAVSKFPADFVVAKHLGQVHAMMAAILYSTDIGYKEMNPRLRSRTHYRSSFMIKALSDYMRDHLTSERVLVRATDLPEAVVERLDRARVFGDSAFMSTAEFEYGVPKPFRNSRDRIVILNGLGTEMKKASGYPDENEILLPPGSVFRLVKKWSYWGNVYDSEGNIVMGKPKYERDAAGGIIYKNGKPVLKICNGAIEYWADDEPGESFDGVDVLVPKKMKRTVWWVKQIRT